MASSFICLIVWLFYGLIVHLFACWLIRLVDYSVVRLFPCSLALSFAPSLVRLLACSLVRLSGCSLARLLAYLLGCLPDRIILELFDWLILLLFRHLFPIYVLTTVVPFPSFDVVMIYIWCRIDTVSIYFNQFLEIASLWEWVLILRPKSGKLCSTHSQSYLFPNLNPVEHVWVNQKKPLQKRYTAIDNTFKGKQKVKLQLAEVLPFAWNAILEEFFEILWKSIPSWVEAVIQAKRWYTRY